MHEETRSLQLRKMLRAKLRRLEWRMQGIGKQEQSGDKLRFFRAQHSRLAATVRMPAEKYAAGDDCAKSGDRMSQAFAIASRAARHGWAIRPILSIWQIAA